MKKEILIGTGSVILTLAAAFTVRQSMQVNAATSAQPGMIYTFETRAEIGPGAPSDSFSIEVSSAPGGMSPAGSNGTGTANTAATAQPAVNGQDVSGPAAGNAPSASQVSGAVKVIGPVGSQQGASSQTNKSTVSQSAPQANAGVAANNSAQSDIVTKNGYKNGDKIGLNSVWKYADFSVINSGKAVMYTAKSNRKNKIIAVNAGHGTNGGQSVKTYCHPDKTPKVTGGTTAAGALQAVAVSSGMTFKDGTPEKTVTLKMAQILKEKLLSAGYDVLMIRDGEDVQLDNIARTVIANNAADIHIALHWDSDGLDTIKGVFYMSVPDKLKSMEPVASHWQAHEALGDSLIKGLKNQGIKIWGSNPLDMDLTQTSFSTIPSVDIELGNQCSDHSDSLLNKEADGLLSGINSYFGF